MFYIQIMMTLCIVFLGRFGLNHSINRITRPMLALEKVICNIVDEPSDYNIQRAFDD
jgi:hypothetical protein